MFDAKWGVSEAKRLAAAHYVRRHPRHTPAELALYVKNEWPNFLEDAVKVLRTMKRRMAELN
jgi:hypothetical protein